MQGVMDSESHDGSSLSIPLVLNQKQNEIAEAKADGDQASTRTTGFFKTCFNGLNALTVRLEHHFKGLMKRQQQQWKQRRRRRRRRGVVGGGQEQKGGSDGAGGGWEVIEEFSQGLGCSGRGRESPRHNGVEVFGAGEVAGVVVVDAIRWVQGEAVG
ncbi:hypothetical protein SO802_001121 [Lithocarpus litseifolius]|uniref:Uncharacterized protein n=1 Tax=Lithocarpus litseifolius TaxID=425828 RepID=A0AAW2DTZ2_9ROSI